MQINIQAIFLLEQQNRIRIANPDQIRTRNTAFFRVSDLEPGFPVNADQVPGYFPVWAAELNQALFKNRLICAHINGSDFQNLRTVRYLYAF